MSSGVLRRSAAAEHALSSSAVNLATAMRALVKTLQVQASLPD